MPLVINRKASTDISTSQHRNSTSKYHKIVLKIICLQHYICLGVVLSFFDCFFEVKCLLEEKIKITKVLSSKLTLSIVGCWLSVVDLVGVWLPICIHTYILVYIPMLLCKKPSLHCITVVCDFLFSYRSSESARQVPKLCVAFNAYMCKCTRSENQSEKFGNFGSMEESQRKVPTTSDCDCVIVQIPILMQ